MAFSDETFGAAIAYTNKKIDTALTEGIAEQVEEQAPEMVAEYCGEHFSEWSGALDSTLANPLMAAPADKVGELKSALTPLNSENLVDSLDVLNACYISYTTGGIVGSGVYSEVRTLKSDNVKKVYLTTNIIDSIPAAIAFYNDDEISADNYMSGYSVQAIAGWHDYAVDVPTGCKLIAFSLRTDQSGGTNSIVVDRLGLLNDTVDVNVDKIDKLVSAPYVNPFRFKPMCDHLFINRTGDNCTIPHESLYHVRLSNRMGFNVIEANVQKTQDNVYFVNHLSSGKFAGYFHHVDGETDISNISANSVTWDWIVNNVRYNTNIAKYQTRPCTLEEFLYECKQQNLIPFISGGDSAVLAIADKYMGKDNYIAYGATRSNAPTAIIYHWVTKSTKADILSYCESVGKPFIYGMANPTSFSDADLKDIIETLHQNGYWIGVSYADLYWYKYRGLGVDINGTNIAINRIENGNICNFDSIYGFSDFTVTNATESDGVLTFSPTGHIIPNIDDVTYQVCGVDLQITFNGSIVIRYIGEFTGSQTYTSDGSHPLFISIPILNGSPKIDIMVLNGTVVSELTFKASVF